MKRGTKPICGLSRASVLDSNFFLEALCGLIFWELLNIWKVEQEKALKNGETIFKSAVAELILKMGIKEY